MQFNKCAVVGVLITLYLSTDSWCLYIPERKTNLAGKKNATSSHSEQIQKCGKELTDFIMNACGGIVNSLDQVNSSRDSVETKITEDCCTRKCSLDYLQSYCEETPVFTSKKTPQEKLLNNSLRSQPSSFRGEERPPYKGKNKGISEVRVRERKYGKRKWGKSKKRKRSFKRKCAYKSFGHYLLKLERGTGVRDNMAKRQNAIMQTWPSIQIGTISPEIDKFGGQPIVEMKRNKSNSL